MATAVLGFTLMKVGMMFIGGFGACVIGIMAWARS